MSENPPPSPELIAKLKQCNLDIQEFVAALQSEISKCAKHSARLEVENIALKVRVETLREKLEGKAERRIDAEEHDGKLAELLKQQLEQVRKTGK